MPGYIGRYAPAEDGDLRRSAIDQYNTAAHAGITVTPVDIMLAMLGYHTRMHACRGSLAANRNAHAVRTLL